MEACVVAPIRAWIRYSEMYRWKQTPRVISSYLLSLRRACLHHLSHRLDFYSPCQIYLMEQNSILMPFYSSTLPTSQVFHIYPSNP